MSKHENDKSALFPKYLTEAIPYISEFYGKTIVVKYGGAAMVNPQAKDAFVTDLVFMQLAGMKLVVVHGGGPAITNMMKKLGKETEFVQGLRVTDKETVDITEMVLVGAVNKDLVASININKGHAVGISGKDGPLIHAVKCPPQPRSANGEGEADLIDMGYVGDVASIDPAVLAALEAGRFIPVVAPVGMGPDGHAYNINADTVAGALAGSLKAAKLLLMTDAPGIMRHPADHASLISSVDYSEIEELISTGVIKGGMIPKVRSCQQALREGVSKCHIIDGRVAHALMLEVLTDAGVGTQLRRKERLTCDVA